VKLSEFAKALGLSIKETSQLSERAGFGRKAHNSILSDETMGSMRKLFAGGSSVDVSQLTDSLNARFGTALAFEAVALAAGLHDAISTTQVEIPTDQVIMELVSSGHLPDTALASVTASAVRGQKGRASSALVQIDRGLRAKTVTDEDNLAWLAAVIAADQEIKRSESRGEPYRPRFEKSHSGKGFIYPDPLSSFLEKEEYSQYVPKGAEENLIYIPLEKFNFFKTHPDQSYQWRSNELLNKFERKLLSLWCIPTLCRQCGAELMGLRKEVKELMRGEKFLPETESVKPSLIFMGSEYHPWCTDLRVEIVDLEVKLQDMQGELGEAMRAATYVNMFHRVVLKHEEAGATSAIVIKAFKDYLRIQKELTDNG
jgi:hypothetical protein